MAAPVPDSEVRRVRRSIERWRRTRPRVSRMPEALWAQAVALTERWSISRISTELGLGYYGLQQRAEAARSEPGFVEMRGADLFGPASSGGEIIVEVRAADGSQLSVRMTKGTAQDVAHLVERFRGERR